MADGRKRNNRAAVVEAVGLLQSAHVEPVDIDDLDEDNVGDDAIYRVLFNQTHHNIPESWILLESQSTSCIFLQQHFPVQYLQEQQASHFEDKWW